MKKVMLVFILNMILQPLNAAGLINEMQSCQGLLIFINEKLDSAPEKYDSAKVMEIINGLDAYDDYIQRTIVTPGLLQANGGDKDKAEAMQQQVDAYKATLVAQFKSRYPENRLYSDQAMAVNNCANKAVPAGDALESLKTALNNILELAQLN